MEKTKCVCGKVIVGVNKNHIDQLLAQHKLSKQHKKTIKEVKK